MIFFVFKRGIFKKRFGRSMLIRTNMVVKWVEQRDKHTQYADRFIT